MTFVDPSPEEKKALEKERWTQAAAGYSTGIIDSRCIAQIYDKYVETLVPILKQLPDSPETKVLDVASASGEPAVSLAKALPNISILSTDIADTYVEFAKLHAEQNGVKNVSFEAADGENLQYSDDTFDAVCCSLGLMFMPSEDKALREFLRVLKPGGVFAATVWGADVPMMTSVMDVAADFDPALKGTGVAYTAMRFGDARGLEEEIKAAGFVDVEHEILDVTFRFDSQDWCEAILKTPMPLKAAFMKAIEEGRLRSVEEGCKVLEGKFKQLGYIIDGKFSMPGNTCHFLTARVPAAASLS